MTLEANFGPVRYFIQWWVIGLFKPSLSIK